MALVVAKADTHVAEAELQALAAEALSHYKRPARYVFIERSEVSLSGTSKPQRAVLAALAAQRVV